MDIIAHPYAMPVIGNHHALETAILGRNLDARASRIKRVFEQFLDSVGRSVYDLYKNQGTTVSSEQIGGPGSERRSVPLRLQSCSRRPG